MIIIILGAPKTEPATNLLGAFALVLPTGKGTFGSLDKVAVLMVHLNRPQKGA